MISYKSTLKPIFFNKNYIKLSEPHWFLFSRPILDKYLPTSLYKYAFKMFSSYELPFTAQLTFSCIPKYSVSYLDQVILIKRILIKNNGLLFVTRTILKKDIPGIWEFSIRLCNFWFLCFWGQRRNCSKMYTITYQKWNICRYLTNIFLKISMILLMKINGL